MADFPFPYDNNIAVVTSWDNAPGTDRLMHRMIDQYGYKGTFFVSPSDLGADGHLTQADVRVMLDSGHEIGSLGLSPVNWENLSIEELQQNLKSSKSQLEAMFGGFVQGFACSDSYAGDLATLVDVAKQSGYQYVRTPQFVSPLFAQNLKSSDTFKMPISAHYREDFSSIQSKWQDIEDEVGGIFHLYGHSEALGEDPLDWVDFECILGFLGGISRVWYCTLGELAAHLKG